MKRLFICICLLIVLIGCGPDKLPITPYPTAVALETDGQRRLWGVNFQYEFAKDQWTPGAHKIQYKIDCTAINQDPFASEWVEFRVSADVAEDDIFPVYIRLTGVSLYSIVPVNLTAYTIISGQPTIGSVSLTGLTESEAQQGLDDCQAAVLIGSGGSEAPMMAIEVFSP